MREETSQNMKLIIKELKKVKDWLHIREIARRLDMKPGSVWYYFEKYLNAHPNIERRTATAKTGEGNHIVLLEYRWKQ